MDRLADVLRSGEFWWVAFGFAAQFLFFMRFLVQWLASERSKQSVIPKAFWYFSLGGGLMLLVYAIHRRDPVFVAGQGVGVLIYLRNIIFIHGRRGWIAACTVVLTVVSAVVFLVGNGDWALWASGEGRAASVARNMYETGDYIVPHFNGETALTKPPLYHWLAALSFRFFGVNEFAARLPSALAGVAAAVLVFAMALKMVDLWAAFGAALMLPLSLEFAWNARVARTDMLNTALVVAALAAWFYAARSKRRAKALFILSFALVGLAFMTKGPAGPVVVLFAGVGYLWITGGLASLRKVPWLAGAIAFLVVAAPWYVVVSASVSAQERNYFLFGQLARWAAGGHQGVRAFAYFLWIYVPYLLKAFFPWSFFLPAAIVLAVKDVTSGRKRETALPLVWFAVGFVAFGLVGAKASRYILPILPASALLVAHLWNRAFSAAEESDRTGRAAGRWMVWSALPTVLVVVSCALLVIAAPSLGNALARLNLTMNLNRVDSYNYDFFCSTVAVRGAAGVAGALGAVVAAVGALAAVARRRLRTAFAFLVVLVFGAMVDFAVVLLPLIDGAHGLVPFAEKLQAVSGGGPVGWTLWSTPELPFYLDAPVDTVPPDEIRSYLEKDSSALIIVQAEDLPRLPISIGRDASVVFTRRVKHRNLAVLGPPGTTALLHNSGPEEQAAPPARDKGSAG